MSQKNKRKKLIEKQLYNELNNLSTKNIIGFKNTKEELANKGLSNSGTYNKILFSLFSKNTEISCTHISDYIIDIQEKTKSKFSNKELDNIKDKTINRYNKYIELFYRKEFEKVEYRSSYDSDFFLLKRNLEYNIINKIEEIKLKNSLSKKSSFKSIIIIPLFISIIGGLLITFWNKIIIFFVNIF